MRSRLRRSAVLRCRFQREGPSWAHSWFYSRVRRVVLIELEGSATFGVTQQWEAHLAAFFDVCGRGHAGHFSDSEDIGLSLGDADRTARIEDVEGVRALHAEVVAGEDEFLLEQAQAF